MSVDSPSLERLSATAVRATVERLSVRIATRFPSRGLARVATELTRLAEDVSRARHDPGPAALGAPRIPDRGPPRRTRDGRRAGPGHAGRRTRRQLGRLVAARRSASTTWSSRLAVFFLHRSPTDSTRSAAAFHRLRSLAHVVDMHQLTKDPERLRADFGRPRRAPRRPGPPQMEHYLDYCSELLSLVGKVAALCAEKSQRPGRARHGRESRPDHRHVAQDLAEDRRAAGLILRTRSGMSPRISSVRVQAAESGSIRSKWPPSTSINSTVAPAARSRPRRRPRTAERHVGVVRRVYAPDRDRPTGPAGSGREVGVGAAGCGRP